MLISRRDAWQEKNIQKEGEKVGGCECFPGVIQWGAAAGAGQGVWLSHGCDFVEYQACGGERLSSVQTNPTEFCQNQGDFD